MDFIFKILRSRPEEYKWLKVILGFPIGFGIGAAFYFILLEQSHPLEDLSRYVGVMFCMAFSIGYATSAQIRCMSWLIIPCLFNKSGRSFVQSFVLICLIQGPITNIITNGKVAVLSFKCASELLKNQSLVKLSLNRKPMEDALIEMKKNDFQLKKFSDQMNQAFSRIENEIEDEKEVEKIKVRTRMIDKTEHSESRADFIEKKRRIDETDNDADVIEKKYARKGDYRCQDVFNSGIENCKKSLDNVYNRCLAKVAVIGYVICKLVAVNFVCDVIKLVPTLIGYTCDSMPVIESGFGELYLKEKAMLKSFGDSRDISFQYKMITPTVSLNVTTVEELQKSMMHEFEKREYWINVAKNLTLRLLAFTFVFLLKSSYDYTMSYLSDINFDNFYVTDYFRYLDKRREIDGRKKKILPLRKGERKYFVSSFTCRLLPNERKKLVSETFVLIVRFVIVLNILLLDHVIFTVLSIIRNQSRIDYHQKGYQKILVKTEGKGFLSHIMRMMLRSFSKEHSIDEISTNFPCLPDPVSSDSTTIYKIGALYAIIWLLLLTQSYALRLRHPVADFFFRRREKTRTLYLYNTILKRREGYIRYMKNQIHRLTMEKQLQREYSMSFWLLKCFSKYSRCMANQLRKRVVCLMCEDPLDSYDQLCPKPNCRSFYCDECWENLGSLCPGCPESRSDEEIVSKDCNK